MQIGKQTAPVAQLRYGHTVVGTSRVKLSELTFEARQGILVRCPGALDVDGADDPVGNAGVVYVGDYRVTADQSDTGGFPLVPGSGVVLPVEDPSELYVIATHAAQIVSWMLV